MFPIKTCLFAVVLGAAALGVTAQDLHGSLTATDGLHLRLGTAARSLPPGTALQTDGVQLSLQGAEGVSRLAMVHDGDHVARAAWTVEAFSEVRVAAGPLVGRAVSGTVGVDRLWLHLAAPPGGPPVACRLRLTLDGAWSGPAGSLQLAVDHDADGRPDVALAAAGGTSRLEVPLHIGGPGRDLLVEIGARATAVVRPDAVSVARARTTLTIELLPGVLAVESGAGCGATAWSLTSRPRLAGLYDLALAGGGEPGESVWLVLGLSRGVHALPGSPCWLWTDPAVVVAWSPTADGALGLRAGPLAPAGTALHAQAVGLAVGPAGAVRVRTSDALRLTTL